MQELNWHTLLIIYGPLGAFAALCAAGAIKYVPTIIASHLDFTNAVKSQGERSTAAVESLSELVGSRLSGNGHEFRDHTFSTHRTNIALSHLANLIQAGAREAGEGIGEAIEPHVVGMKDALSKRDIP
jgi:hypothetical protein